MRNFFYLGRAILPTAIAFTAIALSRASDPIPIKELPSAVRETIEKKYPDAKLSSVEKGSERNDYVYYTVVLWDGETSRTVTVTEVGEILPAAP